MIVDALQDREENLRHCQIHSYVVMPNHVHLLVGLTVQPVNAGWTATAEEFPWSSGRPIGNRPQVGNQPARL
jgi:hypothetical protein